jgi:molybdopterin-guanine dinucleotide biosynthesis protein A
MAGMAVPDRVAFEAVMLAGGASRRMGRDKAFVELGGQPMAATVLRACRGAGAGRVLSVGGDRKALIRMGFEAIADEWPGEGPLGGLVTGLRAARADLVVVTTCDLPHLTADTVTALVGALAAAGGAVAVPVLRGERQYLTAAYRSSALAVLESAFVGGERAPRRAAAALDVVEVLGVDAATLVDVDEPSQLPRGPEESG